jgi:hypothetical protein
MITAGGSMKNRLTVLKHAITFIFCYTAILSGCSHSQPTPTASFTPEHPTTTPIPTVTFTPTPAFLPTPHRPTSGPYSTDQMSRIESGFFSTQEDALRRWVEYWGKSKEPPFNPSSVNLQYKYVFDSNDPTSTIAGVLLENLENGKTFYLPIKDGQFMLYPPEVTEDEIGKFDIGVGFGPLELTRGEYFLTYRSGEWVRADADGNIKEFLDMEEASWQEFMPPNPDINNIDAIPELEGGRSVEIEEIQGILEEMLKSERFAYKVGIIPNFGSSVRAFTSLESQGEFSGYGFEHITLSQSEMSYYTDYNKEARPLKLVNFQKININGNLFVLFSELVNYSEGKITFLHYIMKNDKILEYIIDTGGFSGKSIMPMYIKYECQWAGIDIPETCKIFDAYVIEVKAGGEKWISTLDPSGLEKVPLIPLFAQWIH